MASDFLFPVSEYIEGAEGDEVDLSTAIPDSTSPEAHMVERFAELIERKSALSKELEEVKTEMDGMQPRLLSFFASLTARKLPLEHVTLFVRRDLYARPKDKGEIARQQVCDALRACGMGGYVFDNFNTHSLSGWVRELERNHLDELTDGKVKDLSELLPPSLARVLNVTPDWSIQGRRRTGKKR